MGPFCVTIADVGSWSRQVLLLATLCAALPGTLAGQIIDENQKYWDAEALKATPGWLSQPEKAAVMVIGAHPDDETIFFGGAIPHYALVRDLPVQWITMNHAQGGQNLRTAAAGDLVASYHLDLDKDGFRETDVRNYRSTVESHNAAHIYGMGHAPLTPLFDGDFDTPEKVEYIATQIRLSRPEVIVGHDFDGEYGHFQHVTLARGVYKAYDLAADPNYVDGNLPWQVKKLYTTNASSIPRFVDGQSVSTVSSSLHWWDEHYGVLEGGTSRQVADLGMDEHETQRLGAHLLFDSDPNNNFLPNELYVDSYLRNRNQDPSETWSLLRSEIGPDIGDNNFLEGLNVTQFGTRSAVIAQYNFDGNRLNGEITSYRGSGAALSTGSGDGGQFSPDIPVSFPLFVRGDQSLNLSTGSLTSDRLYTEDTYDGAHPGQNFNGSVEGITLTTGTDVFDVSDREVTFSDIRANGGLSIEVWIKGAGDGVGRDTILTIAGSYAVGIYDGAVEIRNGLNGDSAVASADLSDWTHVAGVFSVSDEDTGIGQLRTDLKLFVDNQLVASLDDTSFSTDVDGGIALGSNLAGSGDFYTGSVFEPTISLGSLSTDEFLTFGIAGDINRDGALSGDGSGDPSSDDIAAFIQGWGKNNDPSDLNEDGTTNLSDWAVLRNLYPSASQVNLSTLLGGKLPVPEPSSSLMSLLCCGIVALGRNR